MRYGKPVYNWKEIPVFMDLPFVSRLLGFSPETLQKRCQRGTFPASKIGGEWRVVRDDLIKHVEENHTMPGYYVPLSAHFERG